MGRQRKSGQRDNPGMASKFIVIYKNGALVDVPIMKPQAPRRNLNAWLGQCASRAISSRVKLYAFRHSKQWHVLGVDHPTPIKSFDDYAAATMFLMHRAARG